MTFEYKYDNVRDVVRNLERRVGELTQARVAPKEVTVRMLRPSDLGLSVENWSYTSTSAFAFTNYISQTIPDDTFVSVAGVFNTTSSPAATMVKVTVGGNTKRLWPLEHMHAEGEQAKTLFFGSDEQIILAPGSVVKIDVVATSTAAQDLGFIGFVGEARGQNIDKGFGSS